MTTTAKAKLVGLPSSSSVKNNSSSPFCPSCLCPFFLSFAGFCNLQREYWLRIICFHLFSSSSARAPLRNHPQSRTVIDAVLRCPSIAYNRPPCPYSGHLQKTPQGLIRPTDRSLRFSPMNRLLARTQHPIPFSPMTDQEPARRGIANEQLDINW